MVYNILYKFYENFRGALNLVKTEFSKRGGRSIKLNTVLYPLDYKIPSFINTI